MSICGGLTHTGVWLQHTVSPGLQGLLTAGDVANLVIPGWAEGHLEKRRCRSLTRDFFQGSGNLVEGDQLHAQIDDMPQELRVPQHEVERVPHEERPEVERARGPCAASFSESKPGNLQRARRRSSPSAPGRRSSCAGPTPASPTSAARPCPRRRPVRTAACRDRRCSRRTSRGSAGCRCDLDRLARPSRRSRRVAHQERRVGADAELAAAPWASYTSSIFVFLLDVLQDLSGRPTRRRS